MGQMVTRITVYIDKSLVELDHEKNPSILQSKSYKKQPL